MRWLAADSAEHSASRERARPKSCGGAGETFPRSVWGYPSLFERNSVLRTATGESGEAWIPVGLLSSGKLLSFRINFIKSSNFKALFDKTS
jgi:hypothetical protein